MSKLDNFETEKYMNYAVTFELISFIVMFAIVIGLITVIVIHQWIKDKHSPRVVTMAKIADKPIEKKRIRTQRTSSAPGWVTHIMYIYYVIFDLEGGEHLKLQVSKVKYNKLKKGTTGKLTFQGKIYIDFEEV